MAKIIKTRTEIDKFLIDEGEYGNKKLKVIKENNKYVLVLRKSSYDVNTLTKEKTFMPAEYILLRKIKENERLKEKMGDVQKQEEAKKSCRD